MNAHSSTHLLCYCRDQFCGGGDTKVTIGARHVCVCSCKGSKVGSQYFDCSLRLRL